MRYSDKDSVKILQVVGGMNPGGIETWLLRILRNIDRDRFKMDFLVHTGKQCMYDEEIKSLGSRIIPCHSPNRPWKYARNFRHALEKFGPYDVVHSQVYLFNGLVVRLAHQQNVPVRIAHIHPPNDITKINLGRKLYKRLMSYWISKYANVILTPSKSTLEAFKKICNISDKLVQLIPNCLDPHLFDCNRDKVAVRQELGLPLDIPLIVYVARFFPHKNHEQVIRVAGLVNKGGKKAHFAMAGSYGESLYKIQKLCESREDVSCFTGLSEIGSLLLASDLFFFPSLHEGFGVAAIEAAAAGLPVVATNLPAIREACPPSHCDFMFPPNDDKAAAENILTILNDEQLRERLSADGREWASQFSVTRSVGELTNVYNLSLNGGKPFFEIAGYRDFVVGGGGTWD